MQDGDRRDMLGGQVPAGQESPVPPDSPDVSNMATGSCLDLEPENVVLLNNKSCTVKLIDFQLSRKAMPGTEVREMLRTPEFVSPEVVDYEPLSLNTDLWSFGVITYIMLSGLSSFLGDTQQQTYKNIVAVDYTFDEEGFENSSDLAKDFIQRLFVKEPR